MKRKSVYTCLVMLFMSLVLQAKDKDVAVAEALLKRLLPSYIESFQFQKLKGEKDCFTIESVKDKIVISGNNANSMAMGLNHYLKYYCLTTVSWYADIAVEIPEELPMVGGFGSASGYSFFPELLHVWLHDALVAMERMGALY